MLQVSGVEERTLRELLSDELYDFCIASSEASCLGLLRVALSTTTKGGSKKLYASRTKQETATPHERQTLRRPV